MKTAIENGYLVISLEGTIDSTNAEEAERQIGALLLENPPLPLMLDAEHLRFISSAGLRMVLRISKQVETPPIVRNVSLEVYDIFEMTGFTSFLDVRRKMRRIDTAGCKVIGRGAMGTVYQIDADTIVKVYDAPDCLPLIQNEQKRSKQAFLWGIPTAISYDIVQAGNKYGSVFEMLKAKNCNEMIIDAPEKADEIIRTYIDFLQSVHEIVLQPGSLPDARDIYAGYLEEMASFLPRDCLSHFRQLLSAMPEDHRVVHGDIQMKNVMFSNGEPLLIDMETLCLGNPVFDWAGLFVTYQAFNEDEPENTRAFLGISPEMSDRIYHTSLRYILDGLGGQARQQAEDKIRAVGYIRFLYLLIARKVGKEALREKRIGHGLEHLTELMNRVESLAL